MVTSHQLAVLPGNRDAWVEVDLAAVKSNLELIKGWLGGQATDLDAKNTNIQIMGVVKSDAYGHGSRQVAKVLLDAGVNWLAVASVDEGIELRSAFPNAAILVLSPTPNRALPAAIAHSLQIAVTNTAAVQAVAAAAREANVRARVHLKVDTGMHRLGCPSNQADALVSEIRGFNSLELISVFSHLAKASEYATTRQQQLNFENALQMIRYADASVANYSHGVPRPTNFLTHLASSEAVRLFSETHYEMVRVGLYLYGLESRSIAADLTPALSVRARINQTMEIAAGESVSYGFTWTATRPTRLANVPIGYADGIDRGLSNRISALCRGREIRQVGTISMDMMVFDITDIPEITEGDIVTLIGRDGDETRYLADWALILDTITYELACRLRLRLPRIFLSSV